MSRTPTKPSVCRCCGQAPSDYPDFARFLVEHGIDSISLNPDAVVKTTLTLSDIEEVMNAALVEVADDFEIC